MTKAVKHNVIDRLWIRTTFTREGNSALCVEALGVSAGEGVPSEEAKEGELGLPCWFFVRLGLGDHSEALAQPAV
jgi:hypothetical protein